MTIDDDLVALLEQFHADPTSAGQPGKVVTGAGGGFHYNPLWWQLSLPAAPAASQQRDSSFGCKSTIAQE